MSSQVSGIAAAIKEMEPRLPPDHTFVDIGAHSGLLTKEIIRHLNPAAAYACEPLPDPYQTLRRRRYHKETSVTVDNLDFAGWYRKHGSRLEGKVDLLLNSHTFCHYPQRSWEGVFEKCSGLLSQAGLHIIIIDAEQNPLALLKPEVEKKLKGIRKVPVYGNFVTGYDIEQFLKARNIAYERGGIEKPITIKLSDDSERQFARLLGFLFRYRAEDVMHYADPLIKKHLNRYGPFRTSFGVKSQPVFQIPRVQDVFLLGKS